ncbi:polyamine aminopropyltransferase [Streptomyces sp. NPDC059816]|uniref:polyamine aminopropyltransferase n=1 Tax=Streptomyces sp. NPDC059816 TaxID=3346960 RepID=UPI0036486C87
MIESPPPVPVAVPPGASPRAEGRTPLPVPAGAARFLVLVGVFVCAACGLAYELELLAVASSLWGDSVTQASLVLSVMVFAMGLGSLAAKRLRSRAAVGFGLIEAVLALIGGCSGMALYAAFAWTGGPGAGAGGGPAAWAQDHRVLLVGFSLAMGVLIGAEVPLLMVLIQRIRRQDASGAVADLFAADYVGALVGGLAFPFLLLPVFGQLTGTLLTGVVNAVAGGLLVLGLFHRDLTRRARRLVLAANVIALALLAAAALLVDDFERTARRTMYGDDVRSTAWTGQQEVVLTGGGDRPVHLYVDGRHRFAAGDAPRSHQPYEALVRPALVGPRARVLVLGGGDGLAARQVLAHPGVRRLDLVEPDAGLVRLARTDPALTALNGGALRDPRVRTTTADVFDWLRAGRAGPAGRGRYDVVICDLPGPGRVESAKLYSREFYELARRMLTETGRLAVRAGGPEDGDQGPRTFWTVEATVRAAGLRTVPYASPAAGVRGWAVVLAGRRAPTPGAPTPGAPPSAALPAAVSPRAPELPPTAPTALTARALADAVRRAERERPSGAPVSTLVHPRYA